MGNIKMLAIAYLMSYSSYMKKANIANVKNNLSRYLEYVKKGGKVRIFDRDTPIAEILPFKNEGSATVEDDLRRLRSLEEKGVLSLASARLEPSFLQSIPSIGPDQSASGVLEALLEERRSGR